MVAAMAWRVKYRRIDQQGDIQKLKLRLENLGVHPQNRGGVYPTGLRCKSLCVDVLKAGFLKEEVCHQMVVVEETPAQHIRSRGEGYECGSAYNLGASVKDEYLSSCFQDPYGDVRHMLLAHNHMMLILRAFLTRANWELPPFPEKHCCSGCGGQAIYYRSRGES